MEVRPGSFLAHEIRLKPFIVIELKVVIVLEVRLEMDLHWLNGFVCLLAIYHLQGWCLHGDAIIVQVS